MKEDETRNCREYCRFSRICYAKGSVGQDPYECPNAWRIEDILNDDPDTETDDDEPEEEFD